MQIRMSWLNTLDIGLAPFLVECRLFRSSDIVRRILTVVMAWKVNL